ncbi:MAG: YggS family pyridoxal phosphate enzyme [Gemmatales bacterium]|nr:MAG: YggS family pyridoxal phosphate enzyme [Gemmatales bacterium]
MPTSAAKAELQTRLTAIRARMEAACRRRGRDPSEVQLVAVTKSTTIPIASLLLDLGVDHLGESRPQELWRKAESLPRSVHWHLIGHLQRNKIERTLPLVELIHSVDSIRLLEALESACPLRRPAGIDVLLEVNCSREPNKHGFAPEAISELAGRLNSLQFVRVRGLMTMAAWQEAEACRPTFVELRQLRDRLRSQLCLPHDLVHLSMGMTNDFEVAIEEGATLIRIGTALFEGLA